MWFLSPEADFVREVLCTKVTAVVTQGDSVLLKEGGFLTT